MVSRVRGDDNFDSAFPTPWVRLGTAGAATAGAGIQTETVLCRRRDQHTYEIYGDINPTDAQSSPVIFTLPTELVADVPANNWNIANVQYKGNADAAEDRHYLRTSPGSSNINYFGTTRSGDVFWTSCVIPVRES